MGNLNGNLACRFWKPWSYFVSNTVDILTHADNSVHLQNGQMTTDQLLPIIASTRLWAGVMESFPRDLQLVLKTK